MTTQTSNHRYLYEIGEDIMFNDEGELDAERLDALEVEFKDKAVRCIAFIKNRKFQRDMCKAEKKRLQAEIKAVEAQEKQYENEQNSVAEYLKGWLVRLGFKKIEQGVHRATVAKRPTSVMILDEAQIPAEFMNEKIEYTPSKTAIKKHFEATGEYVAGTEIIHDQTTLRIRFGKGDAE